ncbi:MAG: DUF3006 domain-containing protein [Desulfitobacteriaceae bacterium]|nr:DUF3006 domain-containing protein [Desulfitobacteriaceae bacterium]
MKGIIDRFEGQMAVIEFEGRIMKNIPKALLPAEAREGDVIDEEKGSFHVNKEETRQRRAEIQKLLDNLWESE